MKKNYTVQLIYIVVIGLLFLTVNFANAQKMSDKVYAGYVVTNEGDSIHGQIRMMTPALNEVKVKITTRRNEKLTFSAKEIQGYAFKIRKYNATTQEHYSKWIYYTKKNVDIAAIPFGTKEVLIERPEAGMINIYNFYLERNGEAQQIMEHKYFVERANSNDLVEINRNNYRTVLKEMTIDNYTLSNKIGTDGYGFKYVKSIVSEYNEWHEMNTEEEMYGLSSK